MDDGVAIKSMSAQGRARSISGAEGHDLQPKHEDGVALKHVETVDKSAPMIEEGVTLKPNPFKGVAAEIEAVGAGGALRMTRSMSLDGVHSARRVDP